MEKPFEVGEWVWVWPHRRWGRFGERGPYAECRGVYPVTFEDWVGWFTPQQLTRNPVIPPKPKNKRMITGWLVAIPSGGEYRIGGTIWKSRSDALRGASDDVLAVPISFEVEE